MSSADKSSRGIALVGCGYVADFYASTLANHPDLTVVSVFDRDPERGARFAAYHRLPLAGSLAQILADPRVGILVNLTNPTSHFAVSKAALEAGKHVYTEKPLAMSFAEAEALVELAERRGLELAAAPCGVLGEAAQTLWRALRKKEIGRVRLVYAELDDGPIHLTNYRSWRSDSGAPWPWKDELEVGCTLEHAGYYVTWLTAFFGPARSVTSFASCLVPDKRTDVPLERESPDFSVACIEFASGVVARLTCSIFAPSDRALRIIGDEGVLSIDDCWDYGSPVMLTRRTPLRLRAEKHPHAARLFGLGPRAYPLVRKPRFRFRARGSNPMDFARGVAELSDAVAGGRSSRLSPRYALHVNEVVLAMGSPDIMGSPRRMISTFDPMEPMSWAERS
jgi:predicted dehydrogenase